MNYTISAQDVWHNPEQIGAVLGLVAERVAVDHAYNAMYDLEGAGRYDRDIRVLESIYKLSGRLTDYFLAEGVIGLFDNWASLIEESKPMGTEGDWETIDRYAGSLCLAARFRQAPVRAVFNGIPTLANETTHPKQVIRAHWERWDLSLQRKYN